MSIPHFPADVKIQGGKLGEHSVTAADPAEGCWFYTYSHVHDGQKLGILTREKVGCRRVAFSRFRSWNGCRSRLIKRFMLGLHSQVLQLEDQIARIRVSDFMQMMDVLLSNSFQPNQIKNK